MSMTIEVDARALQAAFRAAPVKTLNALQLWVDKTAAQSERTAKQEVPVDKGQLQSSIHMSEGRLNATVKPNTKYALYLHEGTGIYGPKKRPITAKNGGFMVFEIGGRKIFARSIRGQKPQPFMDKTYRIVKPNADRDAQLMLDNLVRSI